MTRSRSVVQVSNVAVWSCFIVLKWQFAFNSVLTGRADTPLKSGSLRESAVFPLRLIRIKMEPVEQINTEKVNIHLCCGGSSLRMESDLAFVLTDARLFVMLYSVL